MARRPAGIRGNLAMIALLIGTPWRPDTTNAIVFLEDIHEQKLVLPIGALATLDADAGTARVEERAVGDRYRGSRR